MLLSELTTPFEKHRIIEYKANGNTPVRHWYNAQHITGPLYKSEDIVGDSGLKTFHIFLKYNQGQSGIILCRHMMHPEKYSVEQCEDMLKANNLETPESYIKQLHQKMAVGKFIGNVEIEFVKQFDKESADMFTQHRAAYYAQREAEEKEAAAAQLAVKQAEDNLKQLQKIQERQMQYEVLLGWEEQLSNIQMYRAMKLLNSMIRVDGVVMHHHEFIKKYIKDGWIPHKEENEIHFYGSRFNPKESNPKTNYYLRKDNIAYTITKTEYDFALYIIRSQRSKMKMISKAGKVVVMDSKELMNYCIQAGIDREKFIQCNIERMDNKYFFVLPKEDAPKADEYNYLEADIATQPDIVLIMTVTDSGRIKFEETPYTKRVKS